MAKPPISGSEFWDFVPDPSLLDPENDQFEAPSFEAALDVHGMYETMRFVLRLSPRNHALLDTIDFGLRTAGEVSPEALQAYATYLHETVHWWQHVGSTSGLAFSLCYLGQLHSSLGQLREVLKQVGPKKSLKRWADERLVREGKAAQEPLAAANTAINNALDVEFYKQYAHAPRENAQRLLDHQHFNWVGHGYHIVYSSLIGMISDTIDQNFSFVTNPTGWGASFKKLEEAKKPGYFHRSNVHAPRVGLHAIYEGQARFIQLQFLNGTMARSPTCQDWRAMGFFDGIYVKAFDEFLSLSGSAFPADLDDPLVGLFLLICDLAINPTRGFPLQIENFERFINDVDVGVRFTLLSMAVAQLPHLKTAIKTFSRDEYVDVAAELTAMCGYDHPLAGLETIASWEGNPSLTSLMAEHKTFEFELVNLPIRVFFSHFVSFARDKLKRPEFFCWPGIWMTGARAESKIQKVFLRHLSLFSDRGDKPGVFPRNWPDRDPTAIKSMFERFYGSMSLYDLTRQWLLMDGPFVYDYSWLTNEHEQAAVEEWAKGTFKQVFGVSPDDFEIVGYPLV